MDWHEIALGAVGVVIMLIAWIWVSTTRWLTTIATKFDKHIDDDAEKFSEVLGKMNEYHISILTKLTEREK